MVSMARMYDQNFAGQPQNGRSFRQHDPYQDVASNSNGTHRSISRAKNQKLKPLQSTPSSQKSRSQRKAADAAPRQRPIRYMVQDAGGDLEDRAHGMPTNAYAYQDSINADERTIDRDMSNNSHIEATRQKDLIKKKTSKNLTLKTGIRQKNFNVGEMYLEDQTPNYALNQRELIVQKPLYLKNNAKGKTSPKGTNSRLRRGARDNPASHYQI